MILDQRMEVIMFYRVLFSFLPRPENMNFLSHGFWSIYRSFYESIKDKVIAFYKAELSKLDYDFKIEEALKELVRRRQLALEQGIDPLSSKYPDIFDVLERPDGKSH